MKSLCRFLVVELAWFLLIMPVKYSIVTVDPVFFSAFTHMWVICGSHSLKGEQHHVGSVVSGQVEMESSGCLTIFCQYVASVLGESVFSSPRCLSNIQKVWASLAHQLVDNITRATIYRWLDIPHFSSPMTFVRISRFGIVETHHACSSTFLTLFEADWFFSCVPFQRDLRSN